MKKFFDIRLSGSGDIFVNKSTKPPANYAQNTLAGIPVNKKPHMNSYKEIRLNP